MDLRFNHDTGRGIDFAKCCFEILSGADGHTFGSSDAKLLKKFLSLVFVNIHKLKADYTLLVNRVSRCLLD